MDTITISGYTFTVPTPFAAGHVCTEAEANVLNRQMHANLRRNFAKRVEEVLFSTDSPTQKQAVTISLQGELNALSTTYAFGGPNPISAEALVIAEQIVRQSLRARKLNVTDYTKAQLIDQAETLLAGPQGPEIRSLAETRTKMIRNAAAKELARVVGEGR